MTSADDNLRFPSLASLRAAHTALLKKYREGDSPERTAALEDFIRRGRATGALLDSEDDRQTAQSALDYWSTRLYRPGYEPPDATLDDFDPDLAPELPDELCPYVGLDAFREGKQNLFFGRAKLVNDLVRQLKQSRWLVVLGASGSGKSSIVRAGVLPTLEGGVIPGSQDWFYFPTMVPGSNPLLNLARLTQPTQVAESATAYLQDRNYLANLVRERFSGSVVLTVDQFEEVFTLCADADLRRAFVDNLLSLTTMPEREHRVILTMRADFEAQIALLPDFMPIFESAVARIAPMGVKELRDAIEAPANLVGLKFEAGVVDALLQDILGEEAALPLLQFTLLKLWERRERNRVTWEAYRKLGGGRQALATAADELYNRLIPEEQQTAKRILLRLVKPGEGREVTSSRIRVAALYHQAEAKDRIDRVLDKLLKARLLRLSEGLDDDDDQLEVAHEALIRNWPRLTDWLDEERARLRQRVRLTAAAEQWQRLGKDPSAVWRGILLVEARRYDDLSELENEFVQAGFAADEAEEEARRRAEAQAREAETARQIAAVERRRAEEQSQNARQLRARNTFITALGVLALLAAIAAIVLGAQAYQSRDIAQAANTQSAVNLAEAVAQKATAEAASAEALQQKALAEAAYLAAEQAARDALAEKLAAQAQRPDAERFPEQSRLLTLAALDATTAHGETAIASAEQIARSFAGEANGIPLLAHTEALNGAQFSPDGRWLALASSDATISLWQVDSQWRNPVILRGHTVSILSLAFSRDSRWLVSGDVKGATLVWDLQNPEAAPLALQSNDLYVSNILITKRWLAVSGGDGKVRVWDLTALAPEPAFTLATHTGPVRALASDENWLATGGDDGLIQLWPITLTTSLQPLTLHGHRGAVNALAFSPACAAVITATVPTARFRCIHWLASGSADGTAQLWNFDRGAPVTPTITLDLQGAPVISVMFAPDCNHCARWLTTLLGDDTVALWELTQDVPKGPSLTAPANAYAYSLNCQAEFCQRYLATSTQDYSTFVWTLGMGHPDNKPLTLYGHENIVKALTFSPDGQWLVTASADHTARAWDLPRPSLNVSPLTLDTPSPVTAVAISPQNDWLAAIGNDSPASQWQLTLWPFQDGATTGHAHVFTGTQTTAQHLAISPAGRWLAVSYADNTAQLWDLTQPDSSPRSLAGHSGSILTLAFSPDDKWLATGSRDGTIRLWSLSGASSLTLTVGNWVWSLAFSPDGQWLAAGDQEGIIQIWDLARPEAPFAKVQGHLSFVSALAFSPSGRWLASAGGDNLARLWTREALLGKTSGIDQSITLAGHTAPLIALAFSANEHWLATASDDHSARLWDLTGDLKQGQLLGHQGAVTGLAFSPDCADVAQRCVALTISIDHLARLWDVTVAESVSLGGHHASVTSLSVSSDGRWLSTGGDDATVKVWALRLADLRAMMCNTIGRNLTAEERKQFLGDNDLPEQCTQWK